MKEVYLAHDLHLHGRSCALAEMIDAFSDDAMRTQAVAALQREARILAGLDERHVQGSPDKRFPLRPFQRACRLAKELTRAGTYSVRAPK